MTTQAKAKPFHRRKTTRKGKEGEKILTSWFESKGWITYQPRKTTTPHPIDRCFIKSDTLRIIFADAKVATARKLYGDNGMDYEDFLTYLKLSENIETWVFWLDISRRSCYGIEINDNSEKVAKHEGGKVYFDLKNTKVMFHFGWEQVEKLI